LKYLKDFHCVYDFWSLDWYQNHIGRSLGLWPSTICQPCCRVIEAFRSEFGDSPYHHLGLWPYIKKRREFKLKKERKKVTKNLKKDYKRTEFKKII